LRDERCHHVPPAARIRRPGRAAVRRRLLDAALEVFAERGFAGATLDQIAEAAGLTKGAIYSNFAGKDDLFFAMMHDQVLSQVEALRAVLAASSPGADDRQALRDIGRLLTDDVVTVVLALSNGLAIEQYADPGAVSDDLFGRVLAQLSR
jgi:AcrR family transcriptional regulator